MNNKNMFPENFEENENENDFDKQMEI